MKWNAITDTATSVPTVKIAICETTRLGRCMLGPLIEVVRHDKRIHRGVGAGELPDGPSPLQFELGEVALPPGAGEEGRVEPAQREVDDRGEVGVVAAIPLGERVLREREG